MKSTIQSIHSRAIMNTAGTGSVNVFQKTHFWQTDNFIFEIFFYYRIWCNSIPYKEWSHVQTNDQNAGSWLIEQVQETLYSYNGVYLYNICINNINVQYIQYL